MLNVGSHGTVRPGRSIPAPPSQISWDFGPSRLADRPRLGVPWPSAFTAQATEQVLAERANLLTTEREVMLAAGGAYLDVLRDQQALALQRGNAVLLQNTYRAAQQQHAAGAITQTDLAQAEARLADAASGLATTQAQLAASMTTFTAQVSMEPQRLSAPRLAPQLPATREQVVQVAEAASFPVQRTQHLLEASQQQIGVERSALGPKTSLQGRVERARDTNIQKLNQSDNIGQATLNLDFPLYQGGEEYSRIRQAKEITLRDRNTLDMAQREATRRAATAWEALAAANQRIVLQRRAIAAKQCVTNGLGRRPRNDQRCCRYR